MIADAGVMSLPTVIMIGAVLGGLEGATIFFEPREPYKWQILCAATLRTGCPTYSVFGNCKYTMVVRDGHRRVLWIRIRSCGLSRERRSEIGRRAICDPERRYQGWNYWTSCRHVGDQDDLTKR